MIVENKIYGYLGLCMKSGQIAIGTEATKECIQKRKAKLVVIAEDCSERLKTDIKKIVESYKTILINFGTIEKISKTIGKYNKAVLAVKNASIANKIIETINGGDTIGQD